MKQFVTVLMLFDYNMLNATTTIPCTNAYKKPDSKPLPSSCAEVKNQTQQATQRTNSDKVCFSMLEFPCGGRFTARVFKADSFTPDNPVMLVKGIDVCGTHFEVEIAINELNRSSLSFVEMSALNGYFRSKGIYSSIGRAASMAMFRCADERNALANANLNGFTRFNIIPHLEEYLAYLRSVGGWDSFAWFNSQIDAFFSHFGLR